MARTEIVEKVVEKIVEYFKSEYDIDIREEAFDLIPEFGSESIITDVFKNVSDIIQNTLNKELDKKVRVIYAFKDEEQWDNELIVLVAYKGIEICASISRVTPDDITDYNHLKAIVDGILERINETLHRVKSICGQE